MRIVVLGMGYGGLRVALDLEKGLSQGRFEGEILLIDQYPFHQLVTELHQVAAGSVASEFAAIVLEKIFKGKKIIFQQAKVVGFDPGQKTVQTDHGPFTYDKLILALGGEADLLDRPAPRIPGLREHAFTIQSIQPANQAYLQLQERLFTFIAGRAPDQKLYLLIGGGGTTGVELAGQLADEIPRKCQEYKIRRDAIEVRLIEAADRLVPGLHPEIAQYVAKILERKEIQIHLGDPIARVEKDQVALRSGKILPSSILIWAGGVRGNRLLSDSPFKADPKGRVIVNGYLQAEGFPDVFAIGDCSNFIQPEVGQPSAPTARMAIDQGGWLGRYLMGERVFPFVPSFKGGVISLGKGAAVAIVGNLKFYGRIAYLLKSMITVKYIYSIGGLKLLAYQLRMGVLGKI
ncbi:MAG TPA: NAD(P)/FAD-dependent oxidoreductase [Candidatus Manganitrophaceae bacterium]|nr:NAD(P)/FAD-dependent oxidoreductase [Candidatus Manganitrophaceae bacterium]